MLNDEINFAKSVTRNIVREKKKKKNGKAKNFSETKLLLHIVAMIVYVSYFISTTILQ